MNEVFNGFKENSILSEYWFLEKRDYVGESATLKCVFHSAIKRSQGKDFVCKKSLSWEADSVM